MQKQGSNKLMQNQTPNELIQTKKYNDFGSETNATQENAETKVKWVDTKTNL